MQTTNWSNPVEHKLVIKTSSQVVARVMITTKNTFQRIQKDTQKLEILQGHWLQELDTIKDNFKHGLNIKTRKTSDTYTVQLTPNDRNAHTMLEKLMILFRHQKFVCDS